MYAGPFGFKEDDGGCGAGKEVNGENDVWVGRRERGECESCQGEWGAGKGCWSRSLGSGRCDLELVLL